MLLLYAALICFIQSVLSGITTTPGMQRKSQGQTVTFQWSVTRPMSGFSVYNQTLGYSGGLNAYANTTLDSQNGVVTLTISNIQLSDAGNYSLSVTAGTTTQTDAGALLFVYWFSTSFVNQTSGGNGQQPATEGDTVELTCTVISTSLPAAYRPKVIYYQWYLQGSGGYLQNISSGPAKLQNSDDPIPGYLIKDDGRTLVIASAQYPDTQQIFCCGKEQWSSYQSCGNDFYLPLKYRPYTYSRTPASRKFNAIFNSSVSLWVFSQAFPAVNTATNWSFTDTAGQAQDLPVGSLYSNLYSPYSLAFTFTSETDYGNYSITLSNIIGKTTEIFQVLRPGPPDAPSGVRADFVISYYFIIAWNCMWSNGRPQTTFLQLRSMLNDSVIDSWNYTVYTDCYNYTHFTFFYKGIQPESDYEVRVWSTNNLGSSDVVKLSVRAPPKFKFTVSPKMISLNGNQAIVNFIPTERKIARLDVTCCLELTGLCATSSYYDVNSTAGQMTYGNLPSGDVYVFDFMVYVSDRRGNNYYVAMLKGIRVSTNTETEVSKGEQPNPLPVAIIVLAVLLGVAVLALIGCIIAIIVLTRRQNTQPNNSKQPKPRAAASTRAPQPATQQQNQAYEDEGTYEAVDNEAHYTALEGQRRR